MTEPTPAPIPRNWPGLVRERGLALRGTAPTTFSAVAPAPHADTGPSVVWPSLHANDRAHGRACDPIPRRDLALRNATRDRCTDIRDVGRREVRTRMPLAAQHRSGSLSRPVAIPYRTTALVHPISGVLRIGPQEQMIRTNAGPVVATVAHEEPWRNWAVGQLPAIAVRQDVMTLALEHAVAIPVAITLPRPTVAAPINARPKPVCRWQLALGCVVAVRRAVFRGSRGNNGDKEHAAVPAGALMGTLKWHRTLRTCGVTPPAVSSSAGATPCLPHCNR